ncbi:DNA-binding NarL/FixJ family response regulator [Streptomyces candidus]|uniref:DNA-binding NarL/FixJ family response regulator n=1 Tax=Streptomyces candidus TaxID=67283 RepID=A0A7X0HF88_9ACTN|nr:DNA-binding NarL/FixJ family response regulator [Streptomyces candidus]
MAHTLRQLSFDICASATGSTSPAALRERAPNTRVLILTPFDSESDVLPAIEVGAVGYLSACVTVPRRWPRATVVACSSEGHRRRLLV